MPWLMLNMGYFTTSGRSRQLSEEPIGLDEIASDHTYHTSALLYDIFEKQDLTRDIAGLVAEGSIAECLKVVAELLHEPERACRCHGKDTVMAPPSKISMRLGSAVKEYEWHGGATKNGRCGYLMCQLREIVGFLGKDEPEFLAAVSQSPSVKASCTCIGEALRAQDEEAEMVVGDWAAHNLVRKASPEGAEAEDQELWRSTERESRCVRMSESCGSC